MEHERRTRRRRKLRWNRSFVLLVSVALLVLCAIGSTAAFLIAKTDNVANTFEYANVSCEITETFNGTTKSDVKVKNTGNIPAFIRAKIVVSWKDSSGNVYGGSTPVENTNYEISYGSGWEKQGDYYYYNTAVAADGTTNPLIVSCTQKGEAPAEGYALAVDILADAIQSEPISAAQQAWGWPTSSGN